jgi:glycosyltransferase involved in cell wall biosynthesis
MNILFVTPYPPSRIRVRSFGFVAQLQKVSEVTIFTQCTSLQEQADVEVLRDMGFEVLVIQASKLSSVFQSGMALLGSQPLQVAYAHSVQFAQVLQELCRKRTFDVLHIEHLRGIALIEGIDSLPPIVWDAVDCISLLWKYTIAEGPSLPVRMVARLEHKRTQRYEARLMHRLSHIIVTSERDRQALIELQRIQRGDGRESDEVLGTNIQVLSNGVDLHYFRLLQEKRRRYNIVFSGKMSYHANIATALYLSRQIMPIIWQQLPEATLTIVGSNPPQVIQQLAQDSRIEVTGYIDDIRPYICQATVVLSPMVYSVGIQNKVLEAMALGTPLIATKQVVAALSVQPGRDLLVAETATEFADAALRVMEDAELWTILCQNGRKYVEQHHDWQEVTDRLITIYQQAIADYHKNISLSLIRRPFMLESINSNDAGQKGMVL